MFKTDKLPKLDGRQSEVPISDKSQALVCAGQLAFSGPPSAAPGLRSRAAPDIDLPVPVRRFTSNTPLPSGTEALRYHSTATRLQDRFDA